MIVRQVQKNVYYASANVNANMIVRLLRRDWTGPKKKWPDIATQTLGNLQQE